MPAEDLVWRELDGELAVRNAASGSTHLLGALAAEVLQSMIGANSGFTIGELAARIGKETSAVHEVMTEFERLGLAERAD